MFKFLHAADIHLDSPLRGLERYEGAPVDEIRGASRRAFENLVAFALDEQVAFVLIAGDLYDGDWRDYNTGLFFIAQAARLREAGIPLYVVAGNHDAASRLTSHLHPPDNVHFLSSRAPETRRVETFDVAIHGQGFPSSVVSEDLSALYPAGEAGAFNIGLLHTSLDGRTGHATYAPCTVDGLRTHGYQYWALGHVHRREVVAKEPWIVFPGNLQGRHARETGAKGCTMVSVDDQCVTAVEHVDLDVLRWASAEVDVSEAVTLDDVYDLVGKALEAAVHAADGRPLAVRIALVGRGALHAALRAHQEKVVQECRALSMSLPGAGTWVEKVEVHTDAPASVVDLAAREDALGRLLQGIESLLGKEDLPARLGADLTDLAQKLPSSVKSADEGFDPADPASLRAALDDAGALLAERLLGGGTTP